MNWQPLKDLLPHIIMVKRNVEKGKANKYGWKTGEDVFRWWVGLDNRLKEDDSQITLFGLRLDETDV